MARNTQKDCCVQLVLSDCCQCLEINKKSPEGEMDTALQQPGKPPTGPQEDSQANAAATSSSGGGGGLFRSWFPGWSGWYQSAPATQASAQPASVSPTSQPAYGTSQFAAESGGKPVTTYEEEAEIGTGFFFLCVHGCWLRMNWMGGDGGGGGG